MGWTHFLTKPEKSSLLFTRSTKTEQNILKLKDHVTHNIFAHNIEIKR